MRNIKCKLTDSKLHKISFNTKEVKLMGFEYREMIYLVVEVSTTGPISIYHSN